MNSIEKRNSVKKNYDLIANQYCNDFGTNLDDIKLIEKFEPHLKKGSTIVDLGGGSGKLTNYFTERGFKAVCYDFSENMRINALKLFPHIPYILDDMLNLKTHFKNNSVEAVIAMYSLFHIPRGDIGKLFNNINDILTDKGLFCFSFQIGNKEEFVDEPYLRENGKKALYMNYFSKKEIEDLLNESDFEIIHRFVKHEEGNYVIGKGGNEAIYIIARKRK